MRQTHKIVDRYRCPPEQACDAGTLILSGLAIKRAGLFLRWLLDRDVEAGELDA
jgi:hypothetical protein